MPGQVAIPFEQTLFDQYRMRSRRVFGRILRSHGETPSLMASEPDRRIAMVMGPRGLGSLSGRTAFEMLVEIGYTKDYIAREVSRGMSFYLLVFVCKSAPRLATWDNVIALAAQMYPGLAKVFYSNLSQLKIITLAQIEQTCGFVMQEVDALGADDPRFMTEERLLQSDLSASSVRRFLYHCCRLSDLYAGDGFTTTWDGRRGMREYVVPNILIDTVPDKKLFLLVS